MRRGVIIMRQVLTLQLLCCLVDNGNLPLALPLATQLGLKCLSSGLTALVVQPPIPPLCPLPSLCLSPLMTSRHILKYISAPAWLQFALKLSWQIDEASQESFRRSK